MKFINLRPLLKTLPFVILSFVSLGCQWMETVESTKIPQSEIRQTYVVSASRERTSVTASFQQGSWGKSVDLDAPSRIEHNGRELAQSSLNILGVSYSANVDGVETVHRFVYTNNDGKVFRNEMSFEPLELPDGEIIVSRSQETVIRLSRTVAREEKITVSLKSRQTPPAPVNSNVKTKRDKAVEDYEIDLNNELDESRSAIILKPKNLKKFVVGKARLSVEVSRESALQQQNEAGGTMRWNYSSTAAASVAN